MINSREHGEILIRSPWCGCIRLSREMVISFHDGINGTSGPAGFVILGLKRYSPFLFIVSETAPHVSYPIINPEVVLPGCRDQLPPEAFTGIGDREKSSIQLVSIVEFNGSRRSAFLDLGHPLLINVRSRVGKQLEVDTDPKKIEIPAALLRQ